MPTPLSLTPTLHLLSPTLISQKSNLLFLNNLATDDVGVRMKIGSQDVTNLFELSRRERVTGEPGFEKVEVTYTLVS